MNNKLAIVAMLSVFFYSGCATKKEVVVFDDTKKNKIIDTQHKTSNDSNLDKNIKIVPSDEIVVVETNNKDQEFKVVDDAYNTTSNFVNGEEVILKSIHFEFDTFALTEENLKMATENYQKIYQVSLKGDKFKIKLEGNCDEWGNDEYNFALGLKRATSIKNHLVDKGIHPERIVTVSYGEGNPICKDQTAECWLKNRRVDYILVP